MMEPIAIALRTSSSIHGIRMGSLEGRTALYADEVVLFLEDPEISLLSTLAFYLGHTVSFFYEFSHLHVNFI